MPPAKLSEREKKLMMVTIAVGLAFVFYQFLITPEWSKIAKLRKNLQNARLEFRTLVQCFVGAPQCGKMLRPHLDDLAAVGKDCIEGFKHRQGLFVAPFLIQPRGFEEILFRLFQLHRQHPYMARLGPAQAGPDCYKYYRV